MGGFSFSACLLSPSSVGGLPLILTSNYDILEISLQTFSLFLFTSQLKTESPFVPSQLLFKIINQLWFSYVLFSLSFLRADSMDLSASLDEAKIALDLFMNNKFDEARTLMKPW
jgi:hypothetical protein